MRYVHRVDYSFVGVDGSRHWTTAHYETNEPKHDESYWIGALQMDKGSRGPIIIDHVETRDFHDPTKPKPWIKSGRHG